MGTENLDEHEPRNGGVLPPALPDDATPDEMVKAINGLAVELQLVRLAVRDQGVAIGTVLERIEKALKELAA